MQQEGDKKGTEVRVINDSNKLEPVGLVSLSPHLDAKTAPRDPLTCWICRLQRS